MATRDKTKENSIIYPAGSGIRIRPLINESGGEAFGGSYLVDVPASLTGGRRIREQKKSLIEAKRLASQKYKGAKQNGESFFQLSEQERTEIMDWLPKLRKAGITIPQASEFALTHLVGVNNEVTLADFVGEFLKGKEQRLERGDIRPLTYSNFRTRSAKFVDQFGDRPLVELSAEGIKDWLIGLKRSPRTTKNYLSVVAEIFNEAISAGVIARSPLLRISKHERKVLCGQGSEAEHEPSILTLEEAKSLLTTAQAHPELRLLPFVVLGLYCGLRTEEIKRLDWSSIHLDGDKSSVVISGAIAKKRRIRHVDIPVNAVAWLQSCKVDSGLVAEDRYSDDHGRRFRKLTKLAGFGHEETVGDKTKWIGTWQTNAIRHSFGSYHYALHGDAMLTSRLLGHKSNDSVLFDHYRALASKDAAELYFKLIP
jgi:integrase